MCENYNLKRKTVTDIFAGSRNTFTSSITFIFVRIDSNFNLPFSFPMQSFSYYSESNCCGKRSPILIVVHCPSEWNFSFNEKIYCLSGIHRPSIDPNTFPQCRKYQTRLPSVRIYEHVEVKFETFDQSICLYRVSFYH